jgi:citrate lyase subunit beta/citryl-CoA lyase
MILRTMLFVPGTSPDKFAKALASGADAIVLDLEDGVEATRKDEARRAIGTWLSGPAVGETDRFVRINAAGSPWIAGDLAWLHTIEGRYEGLVLPKVETPEDVAKIARAIPSRRVIPLLETPRGVLRAPAIVSADADIPAVCFGAEDLTAELGIPRTVDGDELLVARSQVVLSAVSIGAEPIDAVFTEIARLELLRDDTLRARALGFTGKMAIHPDQVQVIHRALAPSGEEIAAARKIVDADEGARARGDGAFRLDDRMVDAPVVRRARRVLELAAASAKKSP